VFTLILLAASLGQVNATDGPPREYLQGVIAGRTYWIWGWRDVSGGVRFIPQENHHIYPQYAPKATPKPLPRPTIPNTGIVLESNGTLNSGLDLHNAKPTLGLDTNDPDLAKKLGLDADCPDDKPCPTPTPNVEPLKQLEPYAVPIACLVSGLVLIAVAKVKS
jgi:hypothetical protein